MKKFIINKIPKSWRTLYYKLKFHNGYPPKKIKVYSWILPQPGDVLIPKYDIHIKTHKAWFKFYANSIQFTVNKPYTVFRSRPGSQTIFIMDDGGFNISLNSYKARHFNIQKGG